MFLTFFCAAALCTAMQEPVRVTATLTLPRITVGSTTELQITVESRGALPDIRLPALAPELQILGTSDLSQTQISVPGGRTRVTRRKIVLLPRAEGVYRIPPVTVMVDGARYRTATLDLIVRGRTAGVDRPSSFSSSLSVSLHPDTVYVGQQVLLHAQVTFSEDTRARQSRPATFDPPAPTGFWIQDVPDPITINLNVREGRTVETQTYRRAYFPLTAGEFRFPPARLHYEVRRGLLYAPEARELVSDSALLVVRPLPEQGKPGNFTGAVGRLAMAVRAEPARVRAGDALVLSVELQGIGNVKALPEPRLPEIAWGEVFPPSQESTLEIADDQVGGSKRFRWVIVPRDEGSLTIPAIEYSVFDPELHAYVTLRSDAHGIEVTPGATAAADTTPRPVRRTRQHDPWHWVGSPIFIALQAAPLLVLLGAMQLRRRRTLPPGPRHEAARLRRAIGQLDTSSTTFLADIEHLLCEAAGKVAGVSTHDPAAGLHALGKHGTAERLHALLQEMRHLRYAPHVTYDAESIRRRALDLLAQLTPRRGAGGAAIALGLLLVAASAGAQDDAFRRGVELYATGDYADAARMFTQHTRVQPADAHGWYNLGLASLRAGDRGRAVWAWLRAARYAPRDADVRHNLRTAGAADALRAVLPPDRLTSSERMLAAAAAWWLIVAAVGSAWWRRRRTYMLAALPGAFVLLGIALSTIMLHTRPPLVAPLHSGAVLYAAPTVREEVLGELQVGELATVLQYGEQWLRVRELRGTEGWVERRAVATP